jgi:A/G-specific adenine glycosylase
VLVSEVMLQQTQAARVAPAFERFLATFPTVRALADSSRAEVIRAWDGLGYNRRAVALSEAARVIAREHAGRIPSDPEVLRTLPGIGPYTAAAVVSLAFGVRVPAVDTNVRRVVARARLGADPSDVPAPRINAEAREWLSGTDPSAWNQALMDLGREVCRPRPRCDACPLASACPFASTDRPVLSVSLRQGPFEGSARQLRGAIVRILRHRRCLTLRRLGELSGCDSGRVRASVSALHREGLVVAGPAALAGRPDGRVRLPT